MKWLVLFKRAESFSKSDSFLFFFTDTCGENTETGETARVDCPGTGAYTLETIQPNRCIIAPTRAAPPFNPPRGSSPPKT